MVEESGHLLVEVLFAFMIMAVAFGSAFALSGRGMFVVEDARDLSRAAQVLQAEMDQLRTTSWAALDALPATATVAVDTAIEAAFPGRYALTRTVTTRKTDQLQVVLTVNWTDQRGISHARTFITFFTREGLNELLS